MWLLIALAGLVGWVAGRVYVSRYVATLDREVICADVGVALRDTTIIGAERARRDSAALAERNCAARFEVARQGRRSEVLIALALFVAISVSIASLVSVAWLLTRVGSRLRHRD